MGASLLVALLTAAALAARTLRRGARHRNVTAGAGTGAAVLAALPEFLIAAVLAAVVAVRLDWLPAIGWGTPEQTVLPALAMGIPAGALLGRLLDDALPAAFAEPWARAATAAGLPGHRTARHALRRTLPGLLPQLGLVVVGLTGGAVAVETLYAIPGLGAPPWPPHSPRTSPSSRPASCSCCSWAPPPDSSPASPHAPSSAPPSTTAPCPPSSHRPPAHAGP